MIPGYAKVKNNRLSSSENIRKIYQSTLLFLCLGNRNISESEKNVRISTWLNPSYFLFFVATNFPAFMLICAQP